MLAERNLLRRTRICLRQPLHTPAPPVISKGAVPDPRLCELASLDSNFGQPLKFLYQDFEVEISNKISTI